MERMPTRAWLSVSCRFVCGLLGVGLVLLANPMHGFAQRPRKPALTQLELQTELMNFADRFSEFLGQASAAPAFRNTPELYGDHLADALAALRWYSGRRSSDNSGADRGDVKPAVRGVVFSRAVGAVGNRNACRT